MAAPINRQISTSAQHYSPAIYAFGSRAGGDLSAALSFYRDLTLQADPLAAGFVPMSAVTAKGRNPKLFAIGILPPVQSINESLLLDRSATVSKDGLGLPEYPEVIDDGATETIEQTITRHATQGGLDPNKLARVIQFESGFNPAAVNPNGVFAGLLQFGEKFWPDVARGAGRPEVSWDQMRQMTVDEQMPFVISYMRRRGIKVDSPAGDYYRAVAAPGVLGKPPEFVVYKRGSKAVQQNPLWDRNHDGEITAGEIDTVISRRPPIYPPEPISLKSDADSAVFVGFGSENASAFRQDQARQTDMLNVKFSNAQRSQLLAIKSALQSMMNTPPLRMLVNPNKFGVKSQKIVADGSWTRNGPVVEFWGDDQDKISGSGQVAAFYALDAAPNLGQGGPGLTRHARNFSLAWQNFQSLYLLYKNNGGMYLQDLGRQSKDVVLSTVGSVYIFYDNIMYIGAFDSFNMSEADMKPFTLEYSFEFTVRAAFLLESPPMFGYGGAKMFSGGRRGLQTQSGV